MTPVDRLTRAADTLDRLADAATPGPWKATPSEGLVRSPDFHVGEAGGVDARLIAVTSDPVTVRLIAALLRDEGEWHATGMALDMPSDQFLALADHINERSAS